MKSIARTLLVFALLAWTAAASSRNVLINVDGLACEGCSANIAKKLRALPAVGAVRVDLESHMVSVQFKDGANVSNAELSEVITNAGYDVTTIQRGVASLVPTSPPDTNNAEKTWLQRLVYLLAAALALVIALPWIKRAAANARTPKLDAFPPDAS